jgi:hypothetical protein
MTPAQYWQLKSLTLTKQLTTRQAQDALNTLTRDIHALLVDAGLDPALNYTLNDETQQAVPVDTPADPVV